MQRTAALWALALWPLARGAVRGTIKERYFFREAAGPGWALVGDAGHHKEFVIGDGITEALLQVRRLAAAIGEGTDAALTRWWRARDVAALPYFFWGQEEGALGPPPTLQRVVFSRLATRPDLRARMASVVAHQLSPYEVIAVPEILRWTAGAAVRGQWRVIPEFLAAGRRASAVNRELAARRALLAAAEAEASAAAARQGGAVAMPT